MIQLARDGLRTDLSQSEIDKLRAHFASNAYLRFPNLIEPRLLSFVSQALSKSTFKERQHTVGSESALLEGPAPSMLRFLLNDKAVLELVRELTGVPSIGSFGGRIYKLAPEKGQLLNWHTDVFEQRLLALSINLNPEIHRGGVLLLRERNSSQKAAEIANTGFGDAVIFKVDPGLEHCVTAVEGSVPRIAFAGWFLSGSTESFLVEGLVKQAKFEPLSEKQWFEKDQVCMADGVALRPSKSGGILYNAELDTYYSLDDVGHRIWQALENTHSITQTIENMAQQYEVNRPQLTADIYDFVNKLQGAGLLA